MTLAEILQMMRTPQSSGLGQVSNAELAKMNPELAAMQMQRATAPSGMGNVSDMEMQKLAQAMAVNPAQTMGAPPALSLPANEMQRNYADGQAPIAVGGGLLADEAQMLMNTAYDMSAPREMRINAINRLRELGY
jgi:hypothetical protein